MRKIVDLPGPPRRGLLHQREYFEPRLKNFISKAAAEYFSRLADQIRADERERIRKMALDRYEKLEEAGELLPAATLRDFAARLENE